MAAVAVHSTTLATARLCSTTNKSVRLADITKKVDTVLSGTLRSSVSYFKTMKYRY